MIVKKETIFKSFFRKETVVLCWRRSLFYSSVLAAADVQINGVFADTQRFGTLHYAVFQLEETLAVEPRDDFLVLVVHGDIGVCHNDALCFRNRVADKLRRTVGKIFLPANACALVRFHQRTNNGGERRIEIKIDAQ